MNLKRLPTLHSMTSCANKQRVYCRLGICFIPSEPRCSEAIGWGQGWYREEKMREDDREEWIANGVADEDGSEKPI